MTIETNELSEVQIVQSVSDGTIIHRIYGLVKEHGLSDSIVKLITNEDSLYGHINVESVELCLEDLKNVFGKLTRHHLRHSLTEEGVGINSIIDLEKNCPIDYLDKSTNDRLAMSLFHDKDSNTNIVKHNNGYLLHTTKDINQNTNLTIDYDNLPIETLNDIYNVSLEGVREIRGKYRLEPGDIILFSEFRSIDNFQNIGIVLGTFSKFTHVGIAVKKDGKIYILDATSNKGIALTSPNRYSMNDKYICLRRCTSPKLFIYEQSRVCKKFIDEFVGKEFAESKKFLRAVFGAIPIIGNNTAKKDRLFCSETVGLLLKKLGLLNAKDAVKNSATFAPKDFYNMKISHYDKPMMSRGKNIFTEDYNKIYK